MVNCSKIGKRDSSMFHVARLNEVECHAHVTSQE
jgi:hypothetical protein